MAESHEDQNVQNELICNNRYVLSVIISTLIKTSQVLSFYHFFENYTIPLRLNSLLLSVLLHV